jgi:LacI family transcriptional regulator
MNRRVRIEEVVAATGYSRATVDRVLNGRSGVRERTKNLILETKERLAVDGGASIRFHPVAQSVPGVLSADLLIRVGSGLAAQLKQGNEALGGAAKVIDFYQRSDDDVHEELRRLCRDDSRPLIVAIKNTESAATLLAAARTRGKRIVSMVSDLNHDARDAFVGIDNRLAGQTAAFIIGNVLRDKTARVGVVLGNHSFRCHEDREIGFRSHIRTGFSNLSLADVAVGEDSVERTYEAVRGLLLSEPDLGAIYNVGGGNIGLARALREDGRGRTIFVVTHETNHITIPLAREGLIHFLISQNTQKVLQLALRLAAPTSASGLTSIELLDFCVFTRFNLPMVEVARLHLPTTHGRRTRSTRT